MEWKEWERAGESEGYARVLRFDPSIGLYPNVAVWLLFDTPSCITGHVHYKREKRLLKWIQGLRGNNSGGGAGSKNGTASCAGRLFVLYIVM